MEVKILGEDNSILNQYIAEIRDEIVQKDSLRFRRNLERLGEVFAYEISKTLRYTMHDVKTPLGHCESSETEIATGAGHHFAGRAPAAAGLPQYFRPG